MKRKSESVPKESHGDKSTAKNLQGSTIMLISVPVSRNENHCSSSKSCACIKNMHLLPTAWRSLHHFG